ncbi:uncharacterized protein LOC122056722 isoform X2 [Zingiber officinale]|uniref:uncharacterized protein LOC122056722 isoform X2 n=1 Tax=Zingiber officinale TaxID=94328 RepID=UPI001C4C65C7|nr:uncharacterized protein LOC122056722 isoform X2 [Zingiber officinale]
MGKGHELWNDSALINAFDRAMATYKEMHKESCPGHSFADEKHASESNLGENLHSVSSTREGEHNDDQENLINDVANTCMPYHQDVATNEVLQSQKESLCANICTPELNPHCSKIPVADTQTSYGTYGNDQRNIEYNNLLNQYYELEEKRLQVLQQLQHANYWNPQNPAQSGEYQTEKVLSNHATENYSQHPCSWRSCHGVTVPVIPTACVTCCPSPGLSDSCSQGCLALAPHHFSDGQGYGQSGLCSSCPSCTVDASKKINVTDDNLTKIGMKAAEKVLSSVKSKSSLVSAVCEENEGKEEAAGEHEPKTSSGTQNIPQRAVQEQSFLTELST